MKIHQTDFSKGSVYKNILDMAVPMTMAQLINLLYNMVDRMYISRIPEIGTMALTGLGLCFPIITMVSAFAQLFGYGGAPLCSMERGKGNQEEAENIMGNSFFMLVVSGLVLTVIGLLFYEPILYAFGASDVTFPYASQYVVIYLLGTVFVMISLGMNGFINSQGFGQTGMMTVLLGAVTNIILDPIFIFVFHMGVRGAALATTLSQFLSAAWVIRFLTGRKALLTLKRSSMRLKSKRVFKIMGLGLTGFVMAVTNSLTQIACNACLAQHGGDLYVGVMTILNSLREVITMPVTGLTNGATPVMSYNYGARDFRKVRQAMKFITWSCIIYTTVMWILLLVFPVPFIHIFNNDPQMVEAAVPSLKLYFFGIFMMSLQFAGQNIFVSLGKAKQAVFFSIFRKVVIVVPLTYLLPHLWNLGVNGVFIAEPVSNFIGGLACYITMMITVYPELSGRKLNKC